AECQASVAGGGEVGLDGRGEQDGHHLVGEDVEVDGPARYEVFQLLRRRLEAADDAGVPVAGGGRVGAEGGGEAADVAVGAVARGADQDGGLGKLDELHDGGGQGCGRATS